MSRIALRGGTVISGTDAPPRVADVLVEAGLVSRIGTDIARTDHEIDCTGRLIMPGFIDAHSHADGVIFDESVQHALLRQGVTTVIAGQDGVSYAPGDGVWASEYFAAINGPHPTFGGGSVADLLATYDHTTALNVGYLVPAGTIRAAVMGLEDRSPTQAELAQMRDLVAASLNAGALGLSTGLDYVPGIFADATELAALCEPVAEAGAVYVTHMRGGYETNAGEGLEEIARICGLSGVRAHISHYHVEAAEGLALLDGLTARGVDVTFDMYPYTRGCTLIAMALLPPEYSADRPENAASRLQDPNERARLRAAWFPQIDHKASLGPDWARMVTVAHVAASGWAWAEGLTLEQIAVSQGTDAIDATLDLLVAARLEASAVMAVRNERSDANLGRLFSHSAHMVGSDGIFIGGAPHPRARGTFARMLGTFTRERGDFTWNAAAHHLASRAAERFGLTDRGTISPGQRADLVIVDPERVADGATYADPTALAVGIDDVLVGGVVVLSGGDLTGTLPGTAARRIPSTPPERKP